MFTWLRRGSEPSARTMTPPSRSSVDALAGSAAAAGDRPNTRDLGGHADQRMEGASPSSRTHVDAREVRQPV